MKLILIPLLLLLASCTQYRYDITYEKCNGGTGNLVYTAESGLYGQSFNYPTAGNKSLIYPDGRLANVCEFSYTRNEIK